MTENNDIIVNNGYDTLYDMALDVSDTEIIMKSNCKLCNSDHRAEAESLFDQRSSYSDVARLLEKKGEKIASKNIKNHMEQHYIAQERRLKVRDYALHLKEYLKVKKDQSADLEMCRAIIRKELLEMAAEGSTLTGDLRRKNTELVQKLTDQLISFNDEERKQEGEWALVKVIVEKLDQIVKAEQATATPEMQQRLAKVVNTLIDNIPKSINK